METKSPEFKNNMFVIKEKSDYSGIILASIIGGIFFACGLVTGAVMMYGLFNFIGG